MALPKISTPITDLFGIQHPVLLAGMNIAASPQLAAAVTNAGGLGVWGGVFYTPKMFRAKLKELKENLKDPNAPFGVDLLLPQVGSGARATNYDYTKGDLPELIDITIEMGAKLFVSAVGVPPKFVVDKLHAAGIPVMNMVGAPKHVEKALEVAMDRWERLGRLGVGQKPLVEEDWPPEPKPTEVIADDESTVSDVDSLQDEMVLKKPRRSKAKKHPSWFQKQATQAFQQQLDRNRRSFEGSCQKREQDMETSISRISQISSIVWKVLGR